jgi:hypothetical protein
MQSQCFNQLNKLTTIVISSDIESISNNAFDNLINLKLIYILKNNISSTSSLIFSNCNEENVIVYCFETFLYPTFGGIPIIKLQSQKLIKFIYSLSLHPKNNCTKCHKIPFPSLNFFHIFLFIF